MIICDNDLGMSTFYNILILFLKKTAEAHLFCKFNAHRSAWLQSKNMLDTSDNALSYWGGLPLLLTFNIQFITDILKSIASLIIIYMYMYNSSYYLSK